MADEDQNAQVATPQGTDPGKKVILLIEDDPFLVGMYKDKLEIEGFEVVVAEDGLQGLNFALSKNVDMVLLDILIPKLSGIDLLVRLRQDEKGKNLPVIALTNLSGSGDEEKIRSYGVKDYLVKSNYTPAQVVEVIKKYLP